MAMAMQIEAGSRSKMRSKVQFSHCVSLHVIWTPEWEKKSNREMSGILKLATKKLLNVCL